MSGKYDEIINLPHHVSCRHPPMPMSDRAAQFSPFAALNGYDDAITEAKRLTDQKHELSDDEAASLDHKLQFLSDMLKDQPELTVSYFVPDKTKQGGSYSTKIGHLKKINIAERWIQFADGTKIEMDYISKIEGDQFHDMEVNDSP